MTANRSFVKTDTILDRILVQKAEEVAEIKRKTSFADMEAIALDVRRHLDSPRDFMAALHRDTVALIAEIKKASPSKGVLIDDFQPVKLADTYWKNGASALSVLTDATFFQGSWEHLKSARTWTSIPALRKDFIIDPVQVYESAIIHADAILLIVMALHDSQLAELHRVANDLEMAALVEVHNESELERALKVGATLIGINNRDLKTFNEDLGTTERLAKLVPEEVTLVAESAIRSPEDVRRMGELGAHAVLVGEALVKAGNIPEMVRVFSSLKRDYDSQLKGASTSAP